MHVRHSEPSPNHSVASVTEDTKSGWPKGMRADMRPRCEAACDSARSAMAPGEATGSRRCIARASTTFKCTTLTWSDPRPPGTVVEFWHVGCGPRRRARERQGLLARDAESSYLELDLDAAGPMDDLLGRSITYRVAVGPRAGQKVFSLQSVPARAE